MTRAKVRYYLHNLDGLRQEIADINADLEQYRAMSSDSFLVNQDSDPYKDAPDPSIILPKGKIKPFSNTQVNFSPGHFSDSSPTESLAIHRADFISKLEQELFDKKTVLAAINCVLYYLEGYDRQVDKQIIQLRYKEHMPWSQISKKISYETTTLKHKDCRIMDEIISNYRVRIK
jgi:uncharacterized protein (UPF0335 family)